MKTFRACLASYCISCTTVLLPIYVNGACARAKHTLSSAKWAKFSMFLAPLVVIIALILFMICGSAGRGPLSPQITKLGLRILSMTREIAGVRHDHWALDPRSNQTHPQYCRDHKSNFSMTREVVACCTFNGL